MWIRFPSTSLFFTGIAMIRFALCALPANAEMVEVVLFHTNDFHCSFPNEAAVIETIASLRERHPHSILLDAGDMFESKVPKALISQGKAVVDFMNQAGYDGMTLGDNAFDGFSIQQIQECMRRFSFPVLSANLVVRESGEPLALPYWIYTVNGAKIGVIGIYDEEPLTEAGLFIANALVSVRHYAKLIKNHVHCVVVLSHAGIKKDRQLARSVPDVNVIVGGSSQIPLFEPEKVRNAVIVQAGAYGEYVGVLQIKMNLDQNYIVSYEGRLEPTNRHTVQ
jgi:2',3'-cyclic-nucleotide 2'-phosphodiesterase (5'-nucleotidase family)